MNRIRIAAALAGTAALGLALTACGGSESNSSDGSKGGTAVAPAAAATTKLAATQNDALGQIVTDASGKTLYRFDDDTARPSVSNCNGDCAVKWPPVLVGNGRQVQLEGVDQALVGSVKRADGSTQVTLGGWPLYQFAKDSKPGDTLGQGVGGTWFAATPQGAKAGAQPAGQATEQPAQPSEQPTQQPEQEQTEQPGDGSTEQPGDGSTEGSDDGYGSGDDYGSYGY